MVDIEKETKGPAAPPQREKKEECCYLSIKIDQIILKKLTIVLKNFLIDL
jgi:hypothetical protein